MLPSLALIILVGLALAALCQTIRLPRIIGMLFTGILLGPYVLNLLDDSILGISADLRQIALLIILLKAGLSLNLADLKKVGRPAVLMSCLPASCEILAFLLFAPALLGINRLGTVASKRAYEEEFAAWAQDKPEYRSVVADLKAEYGRIADAYFAREITRETLDALPKRYTAAERAEAVFAQREATERALYRYLFGEYARRCPVQYQAPEFLAGAAAAGSPEAFAERIFSGVWEGSDTTAVNTLARGAKRMQDHIEWLLGTRSLRNLNSARLNELYTAYIKGLREWDAGRAFFPDANLTLRVAYGHVAGYEYADGEYHKPRTTIDGIIAKDNPEIYDYDIPQALRDIHASKEYGRWATRIDGRTTVPVCFLATNHTTGGNSGSPILNARGELVGVNFDRTWRSTMSDVAFDETICRNIAVDIRYVLFVIDRIGGAGYLFGEMDFGKRK